MKQNKVISAACAFIFCALYIHSLKCEIEALKEVRRSMIAAEDAAIDSNFIKPELFLAEELMVAAEHAVTVPAPTTIPIFYNLFIKKEGQIPRVSNFVRDQLLEFMKPDLHGPIFINSIGAADELRKLYWPPTINATLMNHYEKGDEGDTLQELWAYCSSEDTHPEQKVVYLHSKGSYHWHKANDKLRVYLTKGALSEECGHMPDTCNVCSSRMSPMPHPHTSGNMWLSRCEYVRKLIEPKKFIFAMYGSNSALNFRESGCMGTGRYAFEHWIHSHPDVAPCDVDSSSQYTWNYAGIPDKDFKLGLKLAPRFNATMYLKKECPGPSSGISRRERLAEYAMLYKKAPPSSWYGWDWYPKGS